MSEAGELLPFDIVRCIEKCTERDKIIDGQSDVGLDGIEAFLGSAVKGGLGAGVFKTAQGGENHRAQEDTNGDDA